MPSREKGREGKAKFFGKRMSGDGGEIPSGAAGALLSLAASSPALRRWRRR